MKTTTELIATVIFFCALTIQSAESYGADKVIFTQANSTLTWAPLYVARKMGYMAEENIDAEVVIVKSGPDAVSAVTSGSAQVVVTLPLTVLRAIEKGYPLKVFASVTSQIPVQLGVRADVAKRLNLTASTPMAEKIAKLKGLTIATNGVNGGPDLALKYVVKEAGLSPERDLNITVLASEAALLASLEQQRVDGFVRSPPFTDIAIKRFGAVRLVDFAAGEYAPLAGITYASFNATESWLNANPDVAIRVVRALSKALRLIKEKPDVAKEALKSFFPDLDPEIFDAAWSGTVLAFPASARVDREGLQRNLTFSEKTEGAAPKVDLDASFTNRFADLAEARK